MENNTKDKWVMPEYLEKYRDLIGNTGGNAIEELMNDNHTDAFTNMFRSAMIVSVDSQIRLLERLYEKGFLKTI